MTPDGSVGRVVARSSSAHPSAEEDEDEEEDDGPADLVALTASGERTLAAGLALVSCPATTPGRPVLACIGEGSVLIAIDPIKGLVERHEGPRRSLLTGALPDGRLTMLELDTLVVADLPAKELLRLPLPGSMPRQLGPTSSGLGTFSRDANAGQTTITALGR